MHLVLLAGSLPLLKHSYRATEYQVLQEEEPQQPIAGMYHHAFPWEVANVKVSDPGKHLGKVVEGAMAVKPGDMDRVQRS